MGRQGAALIRPADASQPVALIDVDAGHDLAIEGPPGTGKSETITNMIATALQCGETGTCGWLLDRASFAQRRGCGGSAAGDASSVRSVDRGQNRLDTRKLNTGSLLPVS